MKEEKGELQELLVQRIREAVPGISYEQAISILESLSVKIVDPRVISKDVKRVNITAWQGSVQPIDG